MKCLAVVLLISAVGCGTIQGAEDAGGDDGAVADAGAGADAPEPDAPLPNNFVFVTSSTHTGALGGLNGADAVCAARAQEAGLPGTYVAWLSTESTDAIDRLGTARGWVRPDGKPFVDRLEDLVEGRILFPPRLDETGTDLLVEAIWTASRGTGVFLPDQTSCGGWTSSDPSSTARVGSSDGGFVSWTTASSDPCSVQNHLLCFGIDHENPLRFEPASGRIAYRGISTLTPDGSIAFYDNYCRDEASFFELPGTYLAAMVSSAGTSIASRFDLEGDTWVRLDGVPIVENAAALATGPLDAPIVQLANGNYQNGEVWLGAPSFGQPSQTNCAEWTSFAAGTSAFAGLAAQSVFSAEISCGIQQPTGGFSPRTLAILCLQE
jgi:hypothetical protein